MYWYLNEIKNAKLQMFLWFNLILVFSYVLVSWWNKKVQNWKCSCDSILFWFLVMYWYLDVLISWWNKKVQTENFLVIQFDLVFFVFSYVLISWWNKKVQNWNCSCDSIWFWFLDMYWYFDEIKGASCDPIWFWTYYELGPSKRLLLGLWTTYI